MKAGGKIKMLNDQLFLHVLEVFWLLGPGWADVWNMKNSDKTSAQEIVCLSWIQEKLHTFQLFQILIINSAQPRMGFQLIFFVYQFGF